MKIRIKTLANFGGVGLSTGLFGEPGQDYDVPDEEGATLCAEGLADPIAEDPGEGVEKRTEQSAKRSTGRTRKSSQE